MAGSVNKVILLGNLGKDPEVRAFEGGGKIVRFPLATTESYTNRNGERVDHTEWHNITVGRKGLVDVCEQYLKKGHKIYAEGRLRTRSWESDGATKYSTEIQIDTMTMLTSKEEAAKLAGNPMPGGSSAPAGNTGSASMEGNDDLPF